MTILPFTKRILAAIIIASSLLAGPNLLSFGQEVKAKKGRLPQYYSDIVTEMQRQQIYLIQGKYAETLAELEAQMAKLEKQRDAEIEDVLDADQKARLKKAHEQAAAKRKKSAADKKAPP